MKPIAGGASGGAARIDVSLDEVVKAGVLLSLSSSLAPTRGSPGPRPSYPLPNFLGANP